jgi:hypothetical protein
LFSSFEKSFFIPPHPPEEDLPGVPVSIIKQGRRERNPERKRTLFLRNSFSSKRFDYPIEYRMKWLSDSFAK